ncbi:MAG: hypothetical protein ACK55I_45495, partial [bacterium]
GLQIEHDLGGVLHGTAIPDDRLIGEAEAHHLGAVPTAHGDAEGIGDLVGEIHAPGEGRGPAEVAPLDQLGRGLDDATAGDLHWRCRQFDRATGVASGSDGRLKAGGADHGAGLGRLEAGADDGQAGTQPHEGQGETFHGRLGPC